MAKNNNKNNKQSSAEEMDRLRANTDIASQCGGDKDGKGNPLIPPNAGCDLVEPVDPKKPPQAQGTDIAGQDDMDEHVRKMREGMRKPGREKEKNMSEQTKDQSVQENLKEKANDFGAAVKDKASESKDFIAQKYDEATASVDEKEHEDSFTFADHVIEKIAGIAAREIKGILALKGNFIADFAGGLVQNDNSGDPTRGVSVEVGEKAIVVDLKMIVEYGAPAPEIFERLRSHMTNQLKVMTGMDLVELNVEVVDVMTREEFQQASQSRFNRYEQEDMNYVNRYEDQYDQGNRGRQGGYRRNPGY